MHAVRPSVLAAMFAGALAATGGAQSADDAPLAESKAAIQQLQKDQAQRGRQAATSDLKAALPQLATPTPGAVDLPFAPAKPTEESETEKQKSRHQRDWLLEGMGRLGSGKSHENPLSDDKSDKKIDPADPNYLLKMYARQQVKSANENAVSGDQSKDAAVTPDPLAPFMKEWLARSPVDAKLLDGLRTGAGAFSPDGGLPEAMPSIRQTEANVPGPQDGGQDIPGGSGGQPQNPFLQSLTMPEPSRRAVAPIAAPIAPTVVQPAPAPPSIPPSPPVPAVSPGNERKPPPSPLDEARKYFPQQKRF